MIWLTTSTASRTRPLRRYQRGLSGSAKYTMTGTTVTAKPPRQSQKPKCIGVAGQQTADKRHNGEGGGQRHLIDGAVGAPMLPRNNFGSDGEPRQNHPAGPDAGQRAQDD